MLTKAKLPSGSKDVCFTVRVKLIKTKLSNCSISRKTEPEILVCFELWERLIKSVKSEDKIFPFGTGNGSLIKPDSNLQGGVGDFAK